jgi:predicted nucleic acid-binding Zn ribbon protein
VQRERCRLEQSDPLPDDQAAVSIGAIIPRVMARLGLERDRWLGDLREEWPAVAGQDVARHTRPGRLDRERLVVFVDSSVWLNELSRYGARTLLENIRRRFGASRVRSLRFQIDPGR